MRGKSALGIGPLSLETSVKGVISYSITAQSTTYGRGALPLACPTAVLQRAVLLLGCHQRGALLAELAGPSLSAYEAWEAAVMHLAVLWKHRAFLAGMCPAAISRQITFTLCSVSDARWTWPEHLFQCLSEVTPLQLKLSHSLEGKLQRFTPS